MLEGNPQPERVPGRGAELHQQLCRGQAQDNHAAPYTGLSALFKLLRPVVPDPHALCLCSASGHAGEHGLGGGKISKNADPPIPAASRVLKPGSVLDKPITQVSHRILSPNHREPSCQSTTSHFPASFLQCRMLSEEGKEGKEGQREAMLAWQVELYCQRCAHSGPGQFADSIECQLGRRLGIEVEPGGGSRQILMEQNSCKHDSSSGGAVSDDAGPSPSRQVVKRRETGLRPHACCIVPLHNCERRGASEEKQ